MSAIEDIFDTLANALEADAQIQAALGSGYANRILRHASPLSEGDEDDGLDHIVIELINAGHPVKTQSGHVSSILEPVVNVVPYCTDDGLALRIADRLIVVLNGTLAGVNGLQVIDCTFDGFAPGARWEEQFSRYLVERRFRMTVRTS